jgi:3-deoxy-D-manno-octulosonic-acid transferase
MLQQLGVAADAPIIVAGSTHAGEEAILAEQFYELRRKIPGLFLVLVPRHMERSSEVGKELERRGIKHAYRKEITARTPYRPGEIECMIVNTTGELKYFYELATVVFVGKSLTVKGGQNPIEPAALGKPTIFGPNMQNFADVVRCFLAKDAAVQVRNASELESAFVQLLFDASRREQLSRNALEVVRENQGAVFRTLDMITKHLETREVYVSKET